MPDSRGAWPAPDPEPGPAPALPGPVGYALGLLMFQAVLWGVAAAAALAALAVNVERQLSGAHAAHNAPGVIAALIALVCWAVGMAAVSALVSVRIRRGSRQARVAGIVIEVFMTCFGLVLAGANVAAFLFGSVGAVLSAGAVVCLLVRPARDFTQTGSATP